MTFRSILYCNLFECPKLKYAENCAHTARWKMWTIVCKVYIFLVMSDLKHFYIVLDVQG